MWLMVALMIGENDLAMIVMTSGSINSSVFMLI